MLRLKKSGLTATSMMGSRRRPRSSSSPSPESSTYRSPRHKNTPCFRCRLRPRTLLKYFIPTIVLCLIYGFYLYEPHIELAFYSRTWATDEIEPTPPLAGCFDASRASVLYNISEAVYGPKKNEVQAGMMMRFGLDCYDFAGTVQPISPSSRPPLGTPGTPWSEGRVPFHTYWRTDLREFGPRQELMLKSFFATQDLRRTKLVLWSNGDLTNNGILKSYLEKYPAQFEMQVVDIPSLARGTELDGSALLAIHDQKAWVDGDLIRLLLLWNYGGVWVDMDSLLTRDLEPLLEHEFVTQWDCYDKKYTALNGALMRFRKHSPYLCEAFHVINTSRAPRSGTTDWGSILYLKLWRRLVAGGVPPFKILPFCFNDGRSCRIDNRLPDPFVPDHKSGKWTMGLGLEKGGGLDQVLHKIFAVHLHNQWEKQFPKDGWIERLLLTQFDASLEGAE
ncbi:glycosyltransferase family 32 protein [Amanita rubescens]|nr:glycosyltransferase family 32 protein [Amanita rubescens]